jgi:hypothetical protein
VAVVVYSELEVADTEMKLWGDVVGGIWTSCRTTSHDNDHAKCSNGRTHERW